MFETTNGRHETNSGLPSPELWKLSKWTLCGALERWGAMIGVGGVPVVGILAAVCFAASYVDPRSQFGAVLSEIGTVAICAVVPLLLLGACCLDRLEDRLAMEATLNEIESAASRDE